MSSVLIVGKGPAGASAAIYAVRAGMDTTVVSMEGGALTTAHAIENYWGIVDPIPGPELMQNGIDQAKRLGVKFVDGEVVGLSFDDGKPGVVTSDGKYNADAIILATGSQRAKPKIEGFTKFGSNGISYCAVCDANFYKGAEVCVLGNSEYALHEAGELLPVVGGVTLLTNGEDVPEGVPEKLKVDARKIARFDGDAKLDTVVFEDGETLKTSCLFVAIGVAGSADLAKKIGANTDGNRIVIDDKCCTNLPWLFSAGDCCGGLLQVCKAVYEGAEAATSAIKYLRAKAREEKANANKVHVEVKDVDKKTWAAEVLEANSKVLVDFYGDGCVPCAALMPFIHSYADVYGDKIKFTSLNTSKARRLAMGEGINGLPVIAIYENGKQIDALHKDDATPEAVEAMIQKHYDA